MTALALSLLGAVALAAAVLVLAGAAVAAIALRRVRSVAVADSLERTRSFVKRYWGDESDPDAVAADLREMVTLNPRGIREGADAIDELLADPPPPGELIQLVGWDGNHPLDTGTDEEAAEFLREFARMARAVLAEARG